MTPYPLTLLAPARDLETGKAAIDAGADAVYIGAPKFGARQAAGNSIDDIAALVAYGKPFGVQVLATVNTLLSESERQEAAALIHQLYQVGVHAIIVQDLRLLDEDLPPIRIHASTQCDNRTVEQVQSLERLGCSRVVLARELSLDEIRAIREGTSVELEAFVHGALCVSYSGRCYMSEVLLNRSANRGCCAQMCRMRYDLLDENMQEIRDEQGEPIHQRYLLSLQDLDRTMYLKELVDAGVTTFKIEGRLKDRDYVTNIVAWYRQHIDALFPGAAASQGVCTYSFTPDPQKTFHRGGTDYFLHGRTRPMANWNTPKSTGEYIGIVTGVRGKRIVVRLEEGVTLHNGDGLTYSDQGFAVNGIEDNLLTPNRLPDDLQPGTPLFRNADTAFLQSLLAERHLPVTIRFSETPEGFRLEVATDRYSAQGEWSYAHEAAKNSERALQTIREQISKLGDTPFVAGSVEVNTAPYFIPISILNQWRREVIQNLLR